MLCQDSELHRFQIILKPGLSTASLHVINAAELTPHDFDYVMFEDYSICEDTLVTCWNTRIVIGIDTNLVYIRDQLPLLPPTASRMAVLQPRCYYPTLGTTVSFSCAQLPVDLYF